ncbi:hypothetical protein SNE40_021832 [Patella caerulea]|uniref:Uncharacterized protein n=1 Tax=Patella caerulea TaxID=87958 RepID=A0AAN8GCZ0_PATCE
MSGVYYEPTSFLKKTTATELFRELTNAVQYENEDPHDFLLRCMDLQQKITFASKEMDTFDYSDWLINKIFRRTLLTGFKSEQMRMEINSILVDGIANEILIQKLIALNQRIKERNVN